MSSRPPQGAPRPLLSFTLVTPGHWYELNLCPASCWLPVPHPQGTASRLPSQKPLPLPALCHQGSNLEGPSGRGTRSRALPGLLPFPLPRPPWVGPRFAQGSAQTRQSQRRDSSRHRHPEGPLRRRAAPQEAGFGAASDCPSVPGVLQAEEDHHAFKASLKHTADPVSEKPKTENHPLKSNAVAPASVSPGF